MDFGFEARFAGATYPAAVGPENDDVAIYTAEPPPVHLGFEPCQGYWRKRLTRVDLDGLVLIRTFGNFRGERCFVLEQNGDQLHIAYAGHDAYHAEHLGYWMVDRGVYEAVVPDSEVTETWVERVDLPVGAAAAAAAQPVPSAFGEPAAADQPAAPDLPALPELPHLPEPGQPGPSGYPEPGAAETPAAGPKSIKLETGTLIDRFGPERGRLVFAGGTPFEQRSLPPTHRDFSCRAYRVTAPAGLEVLGGPVAPWFGQPGGGEMYELPRTVEELIDLSALERVEEAT